MSISEEIYGLIRLIGENTDETAAARAGALALQGAHAFGENTDETVGCGPVPQH